MADSAQVTKQTMIGELLMINENIAPILLNIGMHCLGCPSSQMETIEEAAMVHGIEPETLVAQINDFLVNNPKEASAQFEMEKLPYSERTVRQLFIIAEPPKGRCQQS